MFSILLSFGFSALEFGNGKSDELSWFLAYDDFYDESLDGAVKSVAGEEEHQRFLRDDTDLKIPVENSESRCSSFKSACFLMEERSSSLRATKISADQMLLNENWVEDTFINTDIFKSKYIELPSSQRLKVGTRVRVRSNSPTGNWISGHITEGPEEYELLGPDSIYNVTQWNGISNKIPRHQIKVLRDFQVGDEIYGISTAFGWLAGHIVGVGIRVEGYVDINFNGNIRANDWDAANVMFRKLQPDDKVYGLIPSAEDEEGGWKLGALEYAVDAEQTTWVVKLEENGNRWKLDGTQIVHKKILERNAELVDPPLYQTGDKVHVKLQSGWSDGVVTKVNIDSSYMVEFPNSFGAGLREPLLQPATEEIKERIEKEKLSRLSQGLMKPKEIIKVLEDKEKENQPSSSP